MSEPTRQRQDRVEASQPDDPKDRHADDAEETMQPQRVAVPWGYVLKRTLHSFTSNQCTDLAAGLTYFAILSLFPAVLALVSILGLFGQSRNGTDALLEIVGNLAPGDSLGFLTDAVNQFVESPAIGFALIAGIGGAVWSASGYVGGFGRALNRMYGVEEGRKIWSLRPTQLGVTLVVLLVISVIALALIVSGPVAQAIGEAVGLGETGLTVWSIAKWPVMAAALVFVLAVLYSATPNIKPEKFRWISIGALVALLILLVASVGFGFYIANFSNYDATYGSLAGIIIFLLWIWIANLALLFGAQLDIEIQRGRQLASGVAAEQELQLPLRSDAAIKALADRDAKDVLEGRRVRRAADRTD
ncbi:membrane protein [Plantibacter flavus]|uniref:Membrane protein n=1 Tax=Plantibacter flavus TaxID=150123 RepID=A0A3N2BYW2_9MICO|nr:YihY/virulence factor BrkB family protein [Plantibacter flavus]ROR80455.1 membrane protein [Plantibacter flavus]SMG34177.1 membrane protein [Plantibacter flavus]